MSYEKDSPAITLRGKLDKLCAVILETQLLGEEKGNTGFVNDLQEILEFVRSLFTVEFENTTPGEISVLGLSSHEIREQSHNPEKYFGKKHLLMHHSMGPLCLRLNLLRTLVRETELAAIAVRKDISEALNSLSGLFYILIYQYLPDNYTINHYVC